MDEGVKGRNFGPWWKPASALTRIEATRALPQEFKAPTIPKSGWKAGQRGPSWTLPLGTKEAGLAASLAIIGSIWVTSNHWPLAALLSQVFWAPPLGMAAEVWSSRRGRAGALVAAKGFGAYFAFSVLVLAGLIVALPAKIEKTLLKLARSPRLGPLSTLSDGIDALALGYNRRVDVALEEDLSLLTEIGSWRLARYKMLLGSPESAARVWLAKPFNPSWRVRADQSMGAAASPVKGKSVPLVEAIEAMAGASREPEFLIQTALAMRSASESFELAQISQPVPLASARHRRPGL